MHNQSITIINVLQPLNEYWFLHPHMTGTCEYNYTSSTLCYCIWNAQLDKRN